MQRKITNQKFRPVQYIRTDRWEGMVLQDTGGVCCWWIRPSVHDQLFGENSRCPGQDEWLTIPDLMFSLQRLPGATKSQRFFAFRFSGW